MTSLSFRQAKFVSASSAQQIFVRFGATKWNITSNIIKPTLEVLSPFPTAHLCEHAFSLMADVKIERGTGFLVKITWGLSFLKQSHEPPRLLPQTKKMAKQCFLKFTRHCCLNFFSVTYFCFLLLFSFPVITVQHTGVWNKLGYNAGFRWVCQGSKALI